jgi:hypothetical protein
MINKEVVPAFDMLLEELERIIPDLNDQAKALMDQKKYDQAQDLISKAKSVVAFQAKVQALREEWMTMQVPSRPLNEVRQPKPVYVAKKGGRTPQSEFQLPILQVLKELGGRAQLRKVYPELEKKMGDRFTEKDLEATSSNENDICWKNNARWARQILVNEGLMAPDSPRGIWEITPAGREALKAL